MADNMESSLFILHIGNAIAADNLAIQGTSASAAMVST